ncbi:MAG: triose-phosphate isomerase [Bacteroidetes bacterium]|nr:triose-phosphate isomerase [Bacteroidota bacterium]
MRKKLIAGNWKMNLTYKDSEKLAKEIISKIEKKDLNKTDVLLCPTFVSLGIVNKAIKDTGISLGAQNISYENNGALTGEISAEILKSVGCEYVIIGHSERRSYFHESNAVINKKIRKAIEFDLKPVFCVGESLVEREDEIYEGIIEKQLTEGLAGIESGKIAEVIIAYEPVWAIGTGLNATPEQAAQIHSFIRKIIQKLYNEKAANEILILYGGSVNENNSESILSAKGIDGALIGGASLKPDDFSKIVRTAAQIK